MDFLCRIYDKFFKIRTFCKKKGLNTQFEVSRYLCKTAKTADLFFVSTKREIVVLPLAARVFWNKKFQFFAELKSIIIQNALFNFDILRSCLKINLFAIHVLLGFL